MDFASLEGLKQKLKEISEKGFIKSHRSNNTGIGKTLEDEMNISENNLPEHDFTIGKTLIELKAQRIEAGTPITLSTKEPTWKMNKFEVKKKNSNSPSQIRRGLFFRFWKIDGYYKSKTRGKYIVGFSRR